MMSQKLLLVKKEQTTGVMHNCNPAFGSGRQRRSRAPGQPQLCDDVEVSLGYIKSFLKKEKNHL